MKHFFLKLFFTLIFLGLLIYAYGTYIEPKSLTVNEHKITDAKITDNFDGFKIVQISDIHYGPYYELQDLKKLVKNINELNPDIVVLTGDLIDRKAKITTTMVENISKELAKIKSGAGKYAISGECDIKFDEWENIISNSGFTNLNNSYDTIYKNGYNFILLAGLSTNADKESIVNKNGPIYNILLMHEPDYADDIEDNKYDLILAGHSHHGQVNVPIISEFLYPKGAQKYHYNYYDLGKSKLYISSGIGNTNFNFRLFNTPCIDVYRLTKK